MPHVSIEHRDLAMICGDAGRFANAKNLLSPSARFLLSSDDAARIVTEIEDRVKGDWYDVARSVAVSEKDCERISGAFAYPGFDLDHVQPADGN
jgi:serine/threonine-protein kinase HipA